MEAIVAVQTITVTQSDVLYVAQQIQRDLRRFHEVYPNFLSMQEVLDLQDSVTTFLINDAVSRFGVSILDPGTTPNTVYHELRYDVTYADPGPRFGTGGQPVARRCVPPQCVLRAWVNWSIRMQRLDPHKQAQIVADTLWTPPGATPPLELKYAGNHHPRGQFGSGPLRVSAAEH